MRKLALITLAICTTLAAPAAACTLLPGRAASAAESLAIAARADALTPWKQPLELPAWARPSGTVYVTERQLGSVTAFDAASGTPLWTRPTGLVPIGVTRPRGTGKVYTSDEGSNRMSVFDARSGAPLGQIPMGPGPHHLQASRDGSRIYVGEFLGNTVGVVDTATDAAIAHYTASPLANARTHAVWLTRDDEDLYTANTRINRSEEGDVSHIDARTGELLCNTPVGIDPSEVIASPDGATGYVSVRGENKVRELDLTGRCPLPTGREAIVGTQPDTLQLTPDGGTLVVTLRGTPAQISLLDTATFSATLVPIPGHTTTGHHWLSADGKLSFVAVESPGGLAVVDNESGAVVADHPYPNPPGGNRPHGVFYTPQVTR
jgi:DNA-binding beta-propeller fold protein YncE